MSNPSEPFYDDGLGMWLLPITPEQAVTLRFDVPLVYRETYGPDRGRLMLEDVWIPDTQITDEQALDTLGQYDNYIQVSSDSCTSNDSCDPNDGGGAGETD